MKTTKDDVNREAIDIVVLWVDESDQQWQRVFAEYSANADVDNDISQVRYRDWGLMPYWFRGIEKFCPWVRKIHFVTCGQKPQWLNLNNPKLNWVKHEDFMPAEYLPTFSSRAIELNLHRIKGLSERFVYFNDDMFVIRPMKKESFFRGGLPCGEAICDVMLPCVYSHTKLSCIILLEKNFSKYQTIKANPWKWFNYRYGKHLWKNFALLKWSHFTGFHNFHSASPLLKSTFEEVWQHCPEEMETTSKSKIRTLNRLNQLNQYIFTYWQYATGRFAPANFFQCSKYRILYNHTLDEICECIRRQSTGVLCINDSDMVDAMDIEKIRRRMIDAFESILPEKSSFEL